MSTVEIKPAVNAVVEASGAASSVFEQHYVCAALSPSPSPVSLYLSRSFSLSLSVSLYVVLSLCLSYFISLYLQ